MMTNSKFDDEMMSIAVRLGEIRRHRRMSQERAAKLSGVGVKSISSFETGKRVSGLKVAQLLRLLEAYHVSPEEFFRDIGALVAHTALTAQERENQ